MSKIYTKKGDRGKSALIDNVQLAKHSPVFQALGDIDELNAQIGVSLGYINNDEDMRKMLCAAQNVLIEIGSLVGGVRISHEGCMSAIHDMEQYIDTYQSKLEKQSSFERQVAHIHVTRAVCRRAERAICLLNENKPMPLCVLEFMNRLGDYLFMVARMIACPRHL